MWVNLSSSHQASWELADTFRARFDSVAMGRKSCLVLPDVLSDLFQGAYVTRLLKSPLVQVRAQYRVHKQHGKQVKAKLKIVGIKIA